MVDQARQGKTFRTVWCETRGMKRFRLTPSSQRAVNRANKRIRWSPSRDCVTSSYTSKCTVQYASKVFSLVHLQARFEEQMTVFAHLLGGLLDVEVLKCNRFRWLHVLTHTRQEWVHFCDPIIHFGGLCSRYFIIKIKIERSMLCRISNKAGVGKHQSIAEEYLTQFMRLKLQRISPSVPFPFRTYTLY